MTRFRTAVMSRGIALGLMDMSIPKVKGLVREAHRARLFPKAMRAFKMESGRKMLEGSTERSARNLRRYRKLDQYGGASAQSGDRPDRPFVGVSYPATDRQSEAGTPWFCCYK